MEPRGKQRSNQPADLSLHAGQPGTRRHAREPSGEVHAELRGRHTSRHHALRNKRRAETRGKTRTNRRIAGYLDVMRRLDCTLGEEQIRVVAHAGPVFTQQPHRLRVIRVMRVLPASTSRSSHRAVRIIPSAATGFSTIPMCARCSSTASTMSSEFAVLTCMSTRSSAPAERSPSRILGSSATAAVFDIMSRNGSRACPARLTSSCVCRHCARSSTAER